MAEGPFRLQRELCIEHVKDHRNFDCLHYEACLIDAAKQRWISWSCQNCSKYKEGASPSAALLGATRRHSNLASSD